MSSFLASFLGVLFLSLCSQFFDDGDQKRVSGNRNLSHLTWIPLPPLRYSIFMCMCEYMYVFCFSSLLSSFPVVTRNTKKVWFSTQYQGIRFSAFVFQLVRMETRIGKMYVISIYLLSSNRVQSVTGPMTGASPFPFPFLLRLALPMDSRLAVFCQARVGVFESAGKR